MALETVLKLAEMVLPEPQATMATAVPPSSGGDGRVLTVGLVHSIVLTQEFVGVC